ncbi:MAG: hypothetical protein MRK02_02325 [Candidatus Scalindua sp.]|nr:hypothetical protein [Candidatus Scalindua sp.]
MNNWSEWKGAGKPAGWTHLHQIAVLQNEDGRQELFAVNTDGALWHMWQTVPDNGWSHWETRGKPTGIGIERTSTAVGRSLCAERSGDGRFHVIAIAGRDVWAITQTAPNNGWGNWSRLGSPLFSGGIVSIDVICNHDGRLQLFALGYNGRLATIQQLNQNGEWGEWVTEFPHDPEIPIKSLVVGQNADGRLELIVTLSSGTLTLVTQSKPGGSFNSGFGNTGIGESVDSIGPLTMERNRDGTLEAAITIEARLVHIRQHVPNQPPSPGGGGWARHNLGRPSEAITVREPVLAANRHGSLEVFVHGSDNKLWHRCQTAANGNWGNWDNLGQPHGINTASSAFAVGQNKDGRLEAFAVYEGKLFQIWQVK